MEREERIKKYWEHIKVVELNGETIYLSKDKFGWHFVAPIYNLETGKTNWKNLIIGASVPRFILTMAFVGILIAAIFEFVNVLNIANECLAKLPFYVLGFK